MYFRNRSFAYVMETESIGDGLVSKVAHTQNYEKMPKEVPRPEQGHQGRIPHTSQGSRGRRKWPPAWSNHGRSFEKGSHSELIYMLFGSTNDPSIAVEKPMSSGPFEDLAHERKIAA